VLYLAVSRDFYHAEDSGKFDAIYSEYEKQYHQLIDTLSEVLGPPKQSLDWQAEEYPDWAVGEHVTCWDHNGSVIWLRIHHEDCECPILIAMASQND